MKCLAHHVLITVNYFRKSSYSHVYFLPHSTSISINLSRKSTFARLQAKEKVTGASAMSRSEIQSWLSSAATPTATDDAAEQLTDSTTWQRDRVLDDWQKSLEFAQGVLLGARTSVRVLFLKDELLGLAKHAGELRFFGI